MRLSGWSTWLIALAAVASVHAQTFYKWTDAHGVTHYSEQRPAASSVQKLHLSAQGYEPAPSTSASPAAINASLRAASDDFRKQACATARNNLRLLSGHAMVLDTGTMASPLGIGSARKLSSEQRVAAKVDAQKQIHEFCGRG